MDITRVKVYKVFGKNKLRATASIVFNDVFMVHNIKVIEGDKGLFVAMPAEKKNGIFKDIAHPITSEMRTQIVTSVLEKYNEVE